MINDMIQNPVLWYNFKGVFTFHVKSIEGMLDDKSWNLPIEESYWNSYINDLEQHYKWIKDYIEALNSEKTI
jgi:hypothetical protein